MFQFQELGLKKQIFLSSTNFSQIYTHINVRVLKKNMINKLTIFERKIMNKIFGPTRTDDG